jgi:hypothetical protein
MNAIIGELVPFAFFATVILIVFFSVKYRYQIRKAIIEKGGNIEFPKRKFYFLEFGSALLGVGLGLVIAAFIQSSGLNSDSKLMMSLALPTFFGGLGLVVAYSVRRKIDKEN